MIKEKEEYRKEIFRFITEDGHIPPGLNLSELFVPDLEYLDDDNSTYITWNVDLSNFDLPLSSETNRIIRSAATQQDTAKSDSSQDAPNITDKDETVHKSEITTKLLEPQTFDVNYVASPFQYLIMKGTPVVKKGASNFVAKIILYGKLFN
jgi:hypothetical protein